jgi:hypothetical protein
MEKKSISIWLSLILIGTFFTILVAQNVSAVIDDQNLSGVIWKSDGSSPTGPTEFCIWVERVPLSEDWYRFPQSGWIMTDDDDTGTLWYYSYVLPYTELNNKWADGDRYRVQVNGELWGEFNGNTTSNGTGSLGDPYPTPYDPVNPSNTYNIINYSAGGGFENEQAWDVRTVAPVDLAPTDIMVNDAPPDPSGIPVGPGDTVIINFTVTNFGLVGTGIDFDVTLWECGSNGIPFDILVWIEKFQDEGPLNGYGNTSGNGFKTTILTVYWTAPSAPGDYYINITVDSDHELLESNELNNTIILYFKIGPDMIPFNVLVDGISPTDPIYVGLGELVEIIASGMNVGNSPTGSIFDISLYNITDPDGPLIPGHSVFPYNIGPLDVGQISLAQTWYWTAPLLAGDYYVNITVDYGKAVLEGNEFNNSYTLHFAVEPDLVPENVTVNGLLVNGYFLVTPLQTVTVGANASNIGNSGTGTFTFVISIRNCTSTGGPLDAPFFISTPVGPLSSGGFSPEVFGDWLTPLFDGSTFDYYVKVTIDYYDDVSEINETNNEFIIHFKMDAPDLTPEKIVVSVAGIPIATYLDPDGVGYVSTVLDVPVFEDVTIVLDAINMGGINMSFGTNVTFYNVSALGAPANATPFYETLPDAIQLNGFNYPGDETSEVGQTVTGIWPNPGPGGMGIYWYINITIDYNGTLEYNGRILELNEFNNTFTLIINLTPIPVTILNIGNPSLDYDGTGATWYVDSTTPLDFTVVGLYPPFFTWYRIINVTNGSAARTWTNYTEAGGGNFWMTWGEGTFRIEYNSTDSVGAEESTKSKIIIVDDTPPTTSIDVGDPRHRQGLDNWNITSLTPITLSVVDNPLGINSLILPNAAGVGRIDESGIFYEIWNADTSSWNTLLTKYSGPFIISGQDGTYIIYYNATDNLGHMELQNSETIYLDNTGPITTIAVGDPKYPKGSDWYVKSTTPFSLSASELIGSGVNASSIQYMVTFTDDVVPISSSWILGTVFDITTAFMQGDGNYYIQIRSFDNLDNEGTIGRIDIYVDDTPPVATLSFDIPRYRANTTHRWNITSASDLLIQPDDGLGSGLNNSLTLYRIYNATYTSLWIISLGAPFNLTSLPLSDGVYTIEYTVTDNLGNNNIFNESFYMDNTAPITIISDPPTGPRYRAQVSDIWNITDTTEFTLNADDGEGCGVNITHYRIYNSTYSSAWTLYSGSFTLSGLDDGIYTIQYESIDYLGNRADQSTDVNLDTTPPTIILDWDHDSDDWNSDEDAWDIDFDTIFTLTGDDGLGSGIQYVEYRVQIDVGNWTDWETVPDSITQFNLTLEEHGYWQKTIEIRGRDNLDNLEVGIPLPFYIEGDTEPPLPPVLTARVSGDDIILEWIPSTDPESQDIHHYLIYRSTEKTGFDFSTPWVDTSGILTDGRDPINGQVILLRTTWNHTDALDEGEEFYYAIRAVDGRTNIGYPSNIAGMVTLTFYEGYNTFSLPLEPFETVSASEMMDDDDFVEDTDTIYRYDADLQRWLAHPKFFPASITDFDLEFGQGYMIFISEEMVEYTFTGSPATSIRFTPGVGEESVFANSLTAELSGTSVVLTWNEDQNASGYRIYRATERTGDDTLTNFTKEHIRETDDTTWTDNSAVNDEYYYMVVPLDSHGIEKSSTYSVGVRNIVLTEGYNLISFELEPKPSRDTAFFTESWFSTDGNAIFYYDRVAGTWVGRTRFLPQNINNMQMDLGQAYIVYADEGQVNVNFIGI